MERERNVVVTIIKKKNVIIVRLTARASVIGMLSSMLGISVILIKPGLIIISSLVIVRIHQCKK